MKLTINLPQFDGFYNSVFDDIYVISDDLESYGDVTQSEYDSIDWQAVENKIAADYTGEFWHQNKNYLKLIGINSISFVKVDSPREYNFNTDKIVVEVDFHSRDFKKYVRHICREKITEFKKFVNDNYSSYDGFFSFYSNDVETWLGEYLKDKLTTDNVIFEGFLTFLLENDAPDYDKEYITQTVLENSYKFLTFLAEV